MVRRCCSPVDRPRPTSSGSTGWKDCSPARWVPFGCATPFPASRSGPTPATAGGITQWRAGVVTSLTRPTWVVQARAQAILDYIDKFADPQTFGPGIGAVLVNDNYDYVLRNQFGAALIGNIGRLKETRVRAVGRLGRGSHDGGVAHQRAAGTELFAQSARWIRSTTSGPGRKSSGTHASAPASPSPASAPAPSGNTGRGARATTGSRPTPVARANWKRFIFALVGNVGAVYSANPPTQQLILFGGSGSLPGYDWDQFGGDRAAVIKWMVNIPAPLPRQPDQAGPQGEPAGAGAQHLAPLLRRRGPRPPTRRPRPPSPGWEPRTTTKGRSSSTRSRPTAIRSSGADSPEPVRQPHRLRRWPRRSSREPSGASTSTWGSPSERGDAPPGNPRTSSQATAARARPPRRWPRRSLRFHRGGRRGPHRRLCLADGLDPPRRLDRARPAAGRRCSTHPTMVRSACGRPH